MHFVIEFSAFPVELVDGHPKLWGRVQGPGEGFVYCHGSQEAIVMGINALTLASILMKKDTTFRDVVIPSAMVSGSHSLRSQAFRRPPWQVRRLARAIPRDLPTRHCKSIITA